MKHLIISAILSLTTTITLAGNSDDLTNACMKGDLAGAKKAIESGADLNAKASSGWNPISAAFFWPEITKLLLDKGADPGGLNNAAMGCAARTGSYKVMELLLNAGADPNTTNVGAAPIQHVVEYTSCKECMVLLLKKGAKLNSINALGGNLLDALAFSYLPAKERAINDQPQTPGWEKLGFVVPEWYKNPDISNYASADEMVKLLVNAGVDINAKNKLGLTPLLTALGRYNQTNEETVLAFVNNGADINVESPTQGHAVLQAAGYGYTRVLEAMFAKGADMNREFKVDDWVNSGQRLKGINPLMWASRNGSLDAVKLLVSKGAKLDEGAFGNGTNIKTHCVTTVKNKTALYFAIESGNIDVVKYLIENTNGDWKKPVKISQMKKVTDLAFETITTCFNDGSYTPSQYAKAAGLDGIGSYLGSKGL